MNIHISTTQEDIKVAAIEMVNRRRLVGGLRAHVYADSCPIANALHGLYPDLENVEVDDKKIHLTLHDSLHVFDMPIVAQVFVNGFDSGESMLPIEFDVEDSEE